MQETRSAPAPADALRELRDLVATYLEGSDDAPRAAELLDILATHVARNEQPSSADEQVRS